MSWQNNFLGLKSRSKSIIPAHAPDNPSLLNDSANSLRKYGSPTSKHPASKKAGTTLSNSRMMVRSNSLPSGSHSFGKIDPQVYTDTLSKGLSSRIVLYYEKSRKDIKPIINRMYNRPGEFPLVHFKKTGPIHSPRQNAMSSPKIKIAAPDRIMYKAGIRTEMLRTCSLISSPIPSEPPERIRENELMGPLDALKEISRKRIHCEEIDGDQIKKQKAELQVEQSIPADTHLYSSKRQRDNASHSQPNSLETQKKRPCTKNNDVLSSLSSSLSLITPKRKFDVTQFEDHTDVYLVPPQRHFKQQRINDANSNFEQNLDTTPAHIHSKYIGELKKSEHLPPMSPNTSGDERDNTKKLTLFNKTYESSIKTSAKSPKLKDFDSDEEESAISYIKPKVISANDTVKTPGERSKLAIMLSCLSGDLDDNEDVVDKPTALTSESGNVSTNAVDTGAIRIENDIHKMTPIPKDTLVLNVLNEGNEVNTNVITSTPASTNTTVTQSIVISPIISPVVFNSGLASDGGVLKPASEEEGLVVPSNISLSQTGPIKTTFEATTASAGGNQVSLLGVDMQKPTNTNNNNCTFSVGEKLERTIPYGFNNLPSQVSTNVNTVVQPAFSRAFTSSPIFSLTDKNTPIAATSVNISKTTVSSNMDNNNAIFNFQSPSMANPANANLVTGNAISPPSYTKSPGTTTAFHNNSNIVTNSHASSKLSFGSGNLNFGSVSTTSSNNPLNVTSSAVSNAYTFGEIAPSAATAPLQKVPFSSASGFFATNSETSTTTALPSFNSQSVPATISANMFVFNNTPNAKPVIDNTKPDGFFKENVSTASTPIVKPIAQALFGHPSGFGRTFTSSANAMPTFSAPPTYKETSTFGIQHIQNPTTSNRLSFGATPNIESGSKATVPFNNVVTKPLFGNQTQSSVQSSPVTTTCTSTTVFDEKFQNTGPFSTSTNSLMSSPAASSIFGNNDGNAPLQFGQSNFGTASVSVSVPNISSGLFSGNRLQATSTEQSKMAIFGQGATNTVDAHNTFSFTSNQIERPAFLSDRGDLTNITPKATFNFNQSQTFGGVAQQQQNVHTSFNKNKNGAFLFGGTNNSAQATEQPSNFTFSNTQSQPNIMGSNIFNITTIQTPASTSATPTTAPFTFGAPETNSEKAFNFAAAPQPTGNLFNPGPSANAGTPSKGRIIRQATRRINK